MHSREKQATSRFLRAAGLLQLLYLAQYTFALYGYENLTPDKSCEAFTNVKSGLKLDSFETVTSFETSEKPRHLKKRTLLGYPQ